MSITTALKRVACLAITLGAVFPTSSHAAPSATPPLKIEPALIRLERPEASEQLQVLSGPTPTRSLDLTRAVRYLSSNPGVATVSATGRVEPRGEGQARITAIRGAQRVSVPVQVTGLKQPAPLSFEHDVLPVLTKAGCNMGGCHGKAEGKGGFKLSVFGFDPEADHEGITRQAMGRRVNRVRPEASLLLLKATLRLPHAGGRRFEEGSASYRLLRRWIAEVAPYSTPKSAPTARIEVTPAHPVLTLKGVQQLRVVAIDAQGRRSDVTATAEYQSNAGAIAEVDGEGWVKASGVAGEAAILTRYMGQVAVCRVTIPQAGGAFQRPSEANFIDRLVWDKLAKLGIPPSGDSEDAEYLRRVSLDLLGTLPTAAEARAFLVECGQERSKTGASSITRARLVDQLLQRPEYADYWAMRWADLLHVDKEVVGPQAAVAFTRWLRRQFSGNRPYDQMVREILTAQGGLTEEGPAALYRVLDKPEELSRSVSQLFLGVRIECAQCHHHPSDRWGQEDYAAFTGFFTGTSRKRQPNGGEAVVVKDGSDVKHPRTGKLVPTRVLGGAAIPLKAGEDRRAVLADWVTAPENPYFARMMVNRLWSHYFGRGLVEPIDDLRVTNPATNEPLLDALAQHLREVRYDLKAFTKTLLASRVYALSAQTMPRNVLDAQNFSHASYRALPAEVLLDALCQATGIPEQFTGWPEGYRAIQVWDNRLPSYFFRIFGRPVRASVCECERSSEPSIAQALHLMNGPEVNDKIRARDGTARGLAESDLPPERIVEELFLGTLTRYPRAAEKSTMLKLFKEAANRREGCEDVLWTLLNSREFVFNH